MSKQKGVLQKVSLVTAVISVVLSIASGIALYLRVQSIGIDNPVSASFLASSFFFLFVAAVLFVIGTTDIPSFNVKDTD